MVLDPLQGQQPVADATVGRCAGNMPEAIEPQTIGNYDRNNTIAGECGA